MKNNTFSLFLYIATLATAFIITLSLGAIPPFILWSIVPPALFAVFLRFRFRPIDSLFKKIYILSVFFVLTVLPGVFHLLWLTDAGEIASGSSTSAIILVWVPIQVVILAVPVIISFEIIRLLFFRKKN